MIQIDMPMPKSCLNCRFSWAGDSCTYCVAQRDQKPDGRSHIHKIKYTCHGREEQEVWREPSCPLIAHETRMMDVTEVTACEEGTVLWVEERQGCAWNLFPLEICVVSTHPDTGTYYLFFVTWRGITRYECDEYNQTWRCWTERPTDAQMKSVSWL